ncbi:NHL domain-containing protein [Cephalotus follicularis]|uniref:NHL domain-containing protein n=1 Tax=Cephalotus follicularis TaxID=3775 RepID=A0A1Q3BMU0_CEPFO|nr:NHL domain-containing protein [Cephalotus follicularis]
MGIMGMKKENVLVLVLALLLLFGVASSAPVTTPAKIVGGFFSNAVSAFMKWLWSLKPATKTAITGRPMMKFESGYTVETVFDGSKLGIEPHSVEVLPSGELLILDSANSNLHRISSSLSLYCRPKLLTGSPEGYAGHVDGKLREARMNHPKGLTVDDRGNIYIADTVNLAIRKISDAGVTTIAGGKWGRGGGHADGPSEDAKFSNDFDVVYIGSSCSLLVIDRGNRAIREIQLHFDDCAYQYGSSFPLGIAVLVAAGFFGYMLALLRRRVGTIVSSQNDQDTKSANMPPSQYQKPLKSVRPPLIPTEDEEEKQEGFFGSLGKLFINSRACATEILGGIFLGFRKKPLNYQHQSQQQYQHQKPWPVQESFVIPDEDEPPSIDTRSPTPRKTYAFMSRDAEKIHQLRQSRAFYNVWEGEVQLQQKQKQKQQQQHHHHQYQSSTPHTYYEQSCEKTNEIVFGAVQEVDRKGEAIIIKPVNYGDPVFDHHNIHTRIGHTRGY